MVSMLSDIGLLTSIVNLIFLSLLEGPLKTRGFNHYTVDLNGTVILTCNITHTYGADQEIIWKNDKQQVASYQQGKLTAGSGFEERIQMSREDVKLGNFSLTISPVEYNDAGLYNCFLGPHQVCDVRLEVLVPAQVSAHVADSFTLPCYAKITKQAGDTGLNVLWEKARHGLVLHWSGNTTVDPGFQDRVSISVERVRQGDLSLTLSSIRLSDQGIYQCICKTPNLCPDKVYPDEVTLTVKGRENNITIPLGQALHIPLYTSDPVRVHFESVKDQVTLCTIEGGSAHCKSQYQNRVSVQNRTLILSSFTEDDKGVYKVIASRTNDTISSFNIATTSTANSKGWIVAVVMVAAAAVVVLLVLVGFRWKKPPCRGRTRHGTIGLRMSEPETEPMRSIGSSDTDTGYLDRCLDLNGSGNEHLKMSIPDSSQMSEDVPGEKQCPQPWIDDSEQLD